MAKPKHRNTKQLYEQVESWNNRVSVGDAVVFRKDDGRTVNTKTRSRASILGGHTAVIWLDGISGCVVLDRVNP
jgi:hypothetical protein